MVKKLDAIKIYELAESGNTGYNVGQAPCVSPQRHSAWFEKNWTTKYKTQHLKLREYCNGLWSSRRRDWAIA